MVNKAIPLAEKFKKLQELEQMLPLRRKISRTRQFADIVPVVCALLPATFNLRGVCFIVALLAEVCLFRVCPDRPTPLTLENPFATLRGQPYSFQDAVQHTVG